MNDEHRAGMAGFAGDHAVSTAVLGELAALRRRRTGLRFGPETAR